MYEHNWYKSYICLKNEVLEDDLYKCIQFINMIKEHRHDKIKRKHIKKFECLVKKHSGYHHNFKENLEGQPPTCSSLTTTTNVFHHASNSTTTVGTTSATTTSSTTRTTAPATPSASGLFKNPAAPSYNNQKWVINLSNTPLSLAQTSLFSMGPNLQSHLNTHLGSICSGHWAGMHQTHHRGDRWA